MLHYDISLSSDAVLTNRFWVAMLLQSEYSYAWFTPEPFLPVTNLWTYSSFQLILSQVVFEFIPVEESTLWN
jgi:hypothetical protein